MPPEAPEFWKTDGVVPKLLKPVSALYLAGHRLNRVLKTPYVSSLPVLCVGNVVAGGSGKTPTVLALANLLKTNGLFL